MKEYEICEGPIVITVVVEGDASRIQVIDPDNAETPALFPTDLSLLAGVANGYSYQVGFSNESLTMSLENEIVSMRFIGKDRAAKTCRVERDQFEQKVNAISLI